MNNFYWNVLKIFSFCFWKDNLVFFSWFCKFCFCYVGCICSVCVCYCCGVCSIYDSWVYIIIVCIFYFCFWCSCSSLFGLNYGRLMNSLFCVDLVDIFYNLEVGICLNRFCYCGCYRCNGLLCYYCEVYSILYS